ncbi:CTLH/CRA C-terminal to lish motif domain-containing protein [Mycena floridula]|nr:CTLH/CRA C-terminal to lish motif domain-containing protein [Mycena floridula]
MTSTMKVNVEGALLFEQPFARVPYENYRKIFRTSQKHVEREFSAVQSTISDITARFKAGEISQEELGLAINTMITKAEGLKRKLCDLHEKAGKPTQDVIRERFQHLALLENLQHSDNPDIGQWADSRLDRWLVDWTLRNGKEKTARNIAENRDIETLVDIDLFTDIRRIETALAQHNCTEALIWCNENKTTLRKNKTYLDFDLRLQEYIELCRQRKSPEAIAYLQKHLVGWQETHLTQIKVASGLLAFPPDTLCGPYKRLYDPSRWTTLVQDFRTAIYVLNTLPTEPLLNLGLYAGLAALKLAACYDESTKNIDCPVCDRGRLGLSTLAEQVPLSHHANSTIVCQISGKIMDEDNMPMAFPDGHVYSREALQDMASKNDGMVTCPRTGASCNFSELRKVFIS